LRPCWRTEPEDWPARSANNRRRRPSSIWQSWAAFCL